MEQRFGRTVRVFLVVLAAAGLYRLAIVPWVEPRYRESGGTAELTPEQVAAIRARADRRLDRIRQLFPPGAWEHDEPIVMESRGMRLLFKQYHSLPDGRVNLVPCTLVVLPDGQRRAAGDAGRTVVMRAPQGAVLEFDEPLDLRAGRLARLIGGSLRGQVTVRGTPTSPESQDDLEVVTRDLELNEFEIRTNEKVEFRYGRSTGRGRGLVATLLPQPGGSGRGPNIGGVDTIRLEREVELRLEGAATTLLPESDATGASAQALPVLVTCSGNLTTNLSANVITLEDAVEVRRGEVEQGGDRLSCHVLAIMLGKPPEAAGSGETSGGLQVTEIQASGTPAVVQSGAAGLEVRTERLGYEVQTRRILLDGDMPVSVVASGLEMEAKSIDYTPGPERSPGSLMAVGPGWLRAMGERPPAVETRWQKWLRVRPDEQGHVASLAGQAEVAVDAQGRLSGAEMHLWFQQQAAEPAAPASQELPNPASLRPLRMLVRGAVEVDVPEVAARTDRMELWFRQVAGAPSLVSESAAAPPPVPATGSAPAQPQMSRPQPAAVRRPPATIRPPAAAARKLLATGDLIRGLVVLSPERNELEEMSLEGQVQLVEQVTAEAVAGAGIDIRGDQLQITRPTRFDARAIVSGRPATVHAEKLDLEGPLIEFDRGRNHVTVDGGGQLTVPVPGGAGLEALGVLGGGGPRPQAQLTANEPLAITWQGRMDFDGQTARFVDRVQTGSGGTSLHAGSLDCIFTQPLSFDRQGRAGGSQPTDVARIACGNGVRIDSKTEAAGRVDSEEHLFVRDLFFDRRTGDVRGTGPGRLTSTRRGGGGLPLGTPSLPGGSPARPAETAPLNKTDSNGMTFLGVDFQRGFTGNMNRRQLEFQQRVETIWGPVSLWEESLDLHAPGGLPEQVVAVTSDVLAVGQTPPVPGRDIRTIELSAGGNVLVEGAAFTARSARLSYSEMKDLLVFEGDGRTDAQLFRQDRIGGPTSSASAGKILYWRQHNRVEVQDARYLDFEQLGGGGGLPSFPGTTPPR